MGLKDHKLLLVVVAKAPVPGEVKTRLTPPFTPQEAVALYQCFLKDRLAEISTLQGIDLAVAFTPGNARKAFERLIGNGFKLFAQKGADLGQRLNHIFIDKLRSDYDAVSIIDSDTPDLPGEIVEQSFRILLSDEADTVYGPCDDGGYYLVGMCRPHPELFEDIPWSTPAVLNITLERARGLGIKTKLLPCWNDLDTVEDLIEYYGRHKRRPPDRQQAGKNTFKYLSQIEKVKRHFRVIHL
ncbi:MAG: TIGR04282 family arsenosugar biosynthesis glycosyltransferase [Desulfobacterales bacterium]